MIIRCLCRLLVLCGVTLASPAVAQDNFRAVPLQGAIEGVQPMTGVVLWSTNPHAASDAISLEYSYVRYSDIVREKGVYDWTVVDRLLETIAARRHQAILRFYFVYVGRPSAVPDYIKRLPDYQAVTADSEGKPTEFCDWSHPELRQFTLDFYTALAQRYDADTRLAFLQTGFGLWAEYHIYDGPMELGKTFPDLAFQETFLRHLDSEFHQLPWMISVDAAAKWAPLAGNPELLRIPFGVFDDSFLCKQHSRVNALNWAALGSDRWQRAPAGGEISYYTRHDQQLALAPQGPHGTSFEQAAEAFRLTFIIGDGQTEFQALDRIREVAMACGYRFVIEQFEASDTESRVTVRNGGIAPLYHDAYVAVQGVRAQQSLRGLLPGQQRTYMVAAGGESPRLEIVCDRLVPGQQIQFEAALQ